MKLIRLILSVYFLSSLNINAAEISKPYALGKSQDLDWELRVNHIANPYCKHEGRPDYVWCDRSDASEVGKRNGVEARLISWVQNPKVKSLYLTYFSASNRNVKKALCQAGNTGKKIHFFINEDSVPGLKNDFSECENIKVYGKGKGPFGTAGAHLMHMKIFMALEADSVYDVNKESKVRFSSSSANLSSYGTSLHFENWLFFITTGSNYIAQQNVCVFKSLFEDKENERKNFANGYKNCLGNISAKKPADIDFYAVPVSSSMPKPYPAMKNMIFKSNGEIRTNKILIAIHRLTTAKIYKDIFRQAAYKLGKYNPETDKGVAIIYDDDTLRSSKKNGGPAHDVGKYDVLSYRSLKRYLTVSFIETNVSDTTKHLFHNKFVITDDAVFQGAGNFTGASLNISGYGNYEQFYIIRIPEIVKAYENAWKDLFNISTYAEDHNDRINDHEDKDWDDFGDF